MRITIKQKDGTHETYGAFELFAYCPRCRNEAAITGHSLLLYLGCGCVFSLADFGKKHGMRWDRITVDAPPEEADGAGDAGLAAAAVDALGADGGGA